VGRNVPKKTCQEKKGDRNPFTVRLVTEKKEVSGRGTAAGNRGGGIRSVSAAVGARHRHNVEKEKKNGSSPFRGRKRDMGEKN